MKMTLIVLLALALIGGGYYLFLNKESPERSNTDTEKTESVNQNNTSQGKLDINVVCEGALAYMSFENGDAADKFVAECKAGEHPEVIERYKAEMNVGAGAEI